ncbi:MAG: glycosyltransferase family 39 protein [Candidatus Melainabacteria bacterium]|nr:glycosyltransferase family 39 protein [Candidatus Melainabacteria bacterium]
MVNTSIIVAVKAKLQWFFFAGLIALVIRLWFCFIDGHVPSVYSCDASEYLRDAQYLETVSRFPASFWSDALTVLLGVATPEVIETTRQKMSILMPLVKQSGFVFPFFIYLSHVIFAAPIDYSSWWAPILIQTVMSAFTCTLIGLLANYAFNYKAGLWAALLAAIYPGFVVNTSRLYSEMFSCFFMCLAFYCLTRISKQGSWKNFLLLGFSLAVMQVARSPLVMITILSLGYLLWIKRRDIKPGPMLWKQLGALFFGSALVLSFSLGVQKLTTGKASLVTDRVGSYNLSTGLNLNDKGWLAYPYPDLTGVEKLKFTQIISDRLKNPKQFFHLMMDKPPRLLKFHWNDFRQKIGFIDNQAQVILHQLIMLSACLGICVGLFTKPNVEERALDFRLFLLVCALSHYIFALFITVPRYALTAMPELLVFGGFALAFLSERIFQIGRRKSALTMSLALLVVLTLSQFNLNLLLNPLLQSLVKAALGAGLFFWLCSWLKRQTFVDSKMACLTTLLMGVLFTFCWAWPAYAHGRAYEFVEISSNPKLELYTCLPAGASKQNSYYLLLDCKNWSEISQGVSVLVGDKEVSGPLIPLLPFLQNFDDYKINADRSMYLEFEYIFTALCRASNISLLDLRQWFILQIPGDLIESLSGSNKLKISVEPKRKGRITTYGAKTVAGKPKIIPSLFRSSWEKAFYGVENLNGFSDSRYEEKVFPQELTQNNNLHLLEIRGKSSPFYGPTHAAICDSPNCTTDNFPEYDKSKEWVITWRGEVECEGYRAKEMPVTITATVFSRDEGGNEFAYVSPWTPSQLTLEPGSNKIEFSFPFKPSGMPGRINRIEIKSDTFKATQIEIRDTMPFPDKSNYRVY